MTDLIKKEFEEALQTITSMVNKTEKAKEKFAEGTSQHTLQKNRLKALHIASSLIAKELTEGGGMEFYTREDFEKALAPIASLISKSEKAQTKLAQGTWQHTMLSNYLKALYLASPLLTNALDATDGEK